jgi:acyl carrier protein
MPELQNRLMSLLTSKFGMPAADVMADRTYEEMDVDSLMIAELSLLIMKEFGVHVADDEIGPDDTLTDTATLLAAKGARV